MSGVSAVSVRVVLPQQLRTLARVGREVTVSVAGAVTARAVLDALDTAYPMLRGTVRDHSGQRRPKVRLFACGEDISHDSPEAPLPEAIASGREALLIVGAISGG